MFLPNDGVRMRRSLAVTVAIASLFTLSTAVPAGATDTTQATAGLIARVAPDQGDVLVGQLTDDGVAVEFEGGVVSVPIDAQSAVVLADTKIGDELKVSLPAELVVEDGRVAEDGTIVYDGADASAAVQVLEDGSTRLQTITNSATGPHEFTYTFGDNVRPVEGEGGRIELLADYGGVAMVVAHVDEAWANDADGDAVPTSYRVEGDALVQVVEPAADTQYPVVADPKVTRTWWNTTVYFNRNETATMAFTAGGIAAMAALIPDVTISKIVAAGAGVSSAYIGLIFNRNKCLKFVYYAHAANVWQEYAGAEAGGYCR
ncbi:hypothetical protein [Cellulomonas iranensis]|uniref:hypothetical protein n=1 Tax=Cellulomonas iranensis TaxID=76862 RepID=UPI001177FE27|nr:hypothetical protein [Cellulomonas iranensis]